MTPHRPVPVPKDLRDEPGPTLWRCAGCGMPLPDSQVPLEECPADMLFGDAG